MIVYTTNQRRSVRYDGSNWLEEVLCASGVVVDTSTFVVLSGADAQAVLKTADNVLSGTQYSTASGVVPVDELVNVSGVVSDTLGDLEVVTLGSGSNSVFKFACPIPAQPVSPVYVRVVFSPRGASSSGTLKLNYDYNLFDGNDDLTPGSFTYSGTASGTLVAGDYEKFKVLNYQIPVNQFSSGSAPFILSMQITRDVSVGGNYGHDVSIASIYVDNVPGAAVGNSAGYVGGNLVVTGDLTVEGLTVLQYNQTPASGTATGTSGSLIIGDDFIYAAPTTNTWKRVPISSF